MDITKVQKKAKESYKIYKKVANYIQSAESLEPIQRKETPSIGRGLKEVPQVDESTHPLTKIQSGNVYVQIPQDDLNAIDFAIQALQFMRKTVQERIAQKDKAKEI